MKNNFTRKTELRPEIFISALNSFSNCRVLVIGDIMVDEYIWGSVERISPEAPVQIVDVKTQEYRLGGCGNVVNNLCSFGASVSVASVIGNGFYRNFVIKEFKRLGVNTQCLIIDEERPATKKTRVVVSNQQILRIDYETREAISGKHQKQIAEFLYANTSFFDVVIISDYAKGVITARLSSNAIKTANTYSIPIVVDPKGKNFSKYSGASIITPNTNEAEIVSKIKITTDSLAEKAALKILEKTNCDAVLITRGERGMTLLEASKMKPFHIPARARNVYDVSGAGDTVASVLGLAIASGLSCEEASFLANMAGGLIVEKLGTAALSKEEILLALNASHRLNENLKEKTLEELNALVLNLKKQDKLIVFANGSFDPLTGEKIELLRNAKRLSDTLIIGINSDGAVKRSNVSNSSIIGETERIKMLSALDFVDSVIVCDEEKRMKILQTLEPDIVLKQNDFPNRISEELMAQKLIDKFSGKVISIDL